MTGALLSAALAVLLWPDVRGKRRGRLADARGGRPAAGGEWRSAVESPLLAAAVAAALGVFTSTLLVAGLAGIAAFVLARVREAGRAERRGEEEVRSLTEGLAVLAAELRGGRSLAAATEAASVVGAGRSLVAAVRSPARFRPTHGDPGVRAALERVAAGASLSARTGCSLATVLTAVEDDLRARARSRLELRAATSGPRAGALVLAGLPLLGLLMAGGVGADPWRVLTTTPAGQVCLVTGVGLELAGLWWSRRLVERALR